MLNGNNIIWRTVPGYAGYEVSNTGDVRSIPRVVPNSATTTRLICGAAKAKRVRSETCKYYYVQLYKEGKPRHFAVHRLVAAAFIPNPENKSMVNHEDGNKLNNNAYNLKWATCSENHRHAFATGLRSRAKSASVMIGTKWGKSSKYHNVSYDVARRKWKASIKHGGRTLAQARFVTEIEAAEHVNYLIDVHELERPKNVIG